MKKKIKNSVASFALIAMFAVVLTSCNRGMGCPNNFSLEQVVPTVFGGSDCHVID